MRTVSYTHLNPLLDNVSETIYFLDTGISALTSYSESGEERIHLYYGEKRVAGFSAMLSRQFFDEWSDSQSWNYLVHPDTCWITAKTDCVYYKITGSHVQELLSQMCIRDRHIADPCSVDIDTFC